MSKLKSEGTQALNQVEHLRDASAKRQVIRAQDLDTGEWVNIGAADNGDGTYSLMSSIGGAEEELKKIRGFDIPEYDEIELGYTGDDLTTVEYKKDDITVATLSLSYTNGNLTNVSRV